ncbi:MAG: PVC-type heme-binding CxxCH protein [Planctomycetaceae bacterium]
MLMRLFAPRFSFAPLFGLLCMLLAIWGPTLSLRAGEQSQSPTSPGADKSLADELPRVPPVEPADAIKTFKLERGFLLELVAAEPDVCDPVDACFDENSRMYVAEMRGYPYSHEPTELFPKGGGKKDACKIRLLEDTDGDGRMDRSALFAEAISWPTSVCCYRGGVFVMAAPHIYYFKDTNGDGVADVREVVYSGLSRSNVQGLANNMKWALDNHIYLAGGRNAGELTHRSKVWGLIGGRDLRFDPLTEEIESVSGGSQFGHSMDDWGNRFVCNNSDHIQHVVFANKYLSRNPYLGTPSALRSIAKEGAAAQVFRTSAAEPWRVVRTRRRVADPKFNNLPTTERFAIGFFTSATGVTIYRGDAYPEEFRGNAFIGDVGGNLVHRKTVAADGATFVATRADKDVEFLTSTDNWFRPVNFVNAPDGTLYILDMYRETIEHPYSIPDDIKAHLDLESGSDRGRIWRLVAPGSKPHRVKKLGDTSTGELVAELESPNAWNRETAQRLLYERQDRQAVAPLRRLFESSKEPRAQLQALWTLEGLKAIDADILKRALKKPSAHVREHAIRIAEFHLDRFPELAKSLTEMVNDQDYRVRLQLEFSLGELPAESSIPALTSLARTAGENRDLRTAILTSVAETAAFLAIQLIHDSQFLSQPGSETLLAELARVAGARKDPQGAAVLLSASLRLHQQPATWQAILQALDGGLRQRGSSLQQLLSGESVDSISRDVMKSLFLTAATSTRDEGQPVDDRANSARLLAMADYKTAREGLEPLLSPSVPQSLQLAAVESLAAHADKGVSELLVSPWKSFSPALRRAVVDAMLIHPERIATMLHNVESGAVKPGEIERDTKQLLLNHPRADIRDQARTLFGDEVSPDRAKVVAEYQQALELTGDLERGKQLVVQKCSVCHKLGDTGHAIGPDLVSTKNKSPADLMISILDPNREAQPNFTSYTVVTYAGTLHNGIIAAETATSITLRRAEGKEDVILRSNVETLASSGMSLMPVGMEKELTPAQMADVIAYVKSIEAPAAK